MDNKITPRRIQAQETKQKLYKNALNLFSKKGYCAVTIDDICDKTQVSKGAFYSHFSSKHDVLVEQSQKRDSSYKRFYNKLPADISATEKLTRFMDFIVQNIQKKGLEAEWVIYVAELAGKSKPRFLMNKDRPLYVYLRCIIDEGCANGEFRADLTVDEMINILMCATRGMIFQWIMTDGIDPLLETARYLLPFIISGLKG